MPWKVWKEYGVYSNLAQPEIWGLGKNVDRTSVYVGYRCSVSLSTSCETMKVKLSPLGPIQHLLFQLQICETIVLLPRAHNGVRYRTSPSSHLPSHSRIYQYCLLKNINATQISGHGRARLNKWCAVQCQGYNVHWCPTSKAVGNLNPNIRWHHRQPCYLTQMCCHAWN